MANLRYKFRAWDKEFKVMVYDNEITGHIEYDTNAVRAINIMLNEDDYGLEFMQYTGLKDKNGIEIYEGDLLLRRWELFNRLRIVGFKNGSFVATNHPTERQRFNTFSLYETEEHSSTLEHWEVIGNIYENPDLLEEAK